MSEVILGKVRMTKLQKANNRLKKEYSCLKLSKMEKALFKDGYIFGYERAEYDLFFHFSKLTMRIFNKRFSKSYDLQDEDKKRK